MITSLYDEAEKLVAQLTEITAAIYLREKDTFGEMKIQGKTADWARRIMEASNRDGWGGCILCRS